MYNCDCLIHPFQNDPGTSQSQRVMDDLLSGAARIDARTLADLLDFFTQMSRHINFYNQDMRVGDWQPFFRKSIPFILASAIRTPLGDAEQNFAYYNGLFLKRPSSSGLQLHAWFIYYRFIHKINSWYVSVKDTGLPIETFLFSLIKDKLSVPLKSFIGYANAAVKYYGIRKIDFLSLDTAAWNLDVADLYVIDASFQTGTSSKFQQINQLFDKFKLIFQPFYSAVQAIVPEAENNLEESLLPLKAELQKKQPPHLALLFTFLNIFRQLQGDLNGFTRKHLDFFYKEVLQIKPQDAVPDKAFVVFEIQKQLKSYLLKKGLLVKDGKDANKQEILFSLDDDIAANQTQVAGIRTLFLNNLPAYGQTYVEGAYMAIDATKSDGVTKDFPDGQPANFSTLGAKQSKYVDPDSGLVKPYPGVRFGCILASPVLYLKEGDREINIVLACRLNDSVCTDAGKMMIQNTMDCCNPAPDGAAINQQTNPYPVFLSPQAIFTAVQNGISQQYIYLSEDIFKAAIAKGLDEDFVNQARTRFMTGDVAYKPCYCDTPVYKTETSVPLSDWNSFVSSFTDKKLLIDQIFIPESVLNISFSGEKDWIKPTSVSITMGNLSGGDFMLSVNASIGADQPPVIFYSKENLKEDFGTTAPLVKIELNSHLKFDFQIAAPAKNAGGGCCEQSDDCCLLLSNNSRWQTISYYHFFRNVTLLKGSGAGNTRIDVQVCGLKHFVVQNDESLQDVNGPVYPFGTRPVIRNFDIYNLPIVHNTDNSGPTFYIGSKEVFCKRWKNVRINLNWKGKPADFREYYKGYVVEDPNATPQVFGLDEDHFLIKVSALAGGEWTGETGFRKLFDKVPPDALPLLPPNTSSCDHPGTYSQGILLNASDLGMADRKFNISPSDFVKFDASSMDGFIKINLRDQDFLHKDYAFVLSRQMMALGRYPDALFEGAVYKVDGNTVIVFRSTGKTIVELKDDINATKFKAVTSSGKAGQLKNTFDNAINLGAAPPFDSIDDGERDTLMPLVDDNKTLADDTLTQADATKDKLDSLQKLLNIFDLVTGEIVKPLTVLIPNEPWTPIISNMSLDYTASATIEDIDLIHLYPYPGTYKPEEMSMQPALFPTFCDEGTMFIGLLSLVPGNNLNLLFQLAEATSDAESEKQQVQWSYLGKNVWTPLRTGFEVLDDATGNLTASGIVKLALPENITDDNTVMPSGMYWIKVSVTKNSRAVSETTGIFAQAIRVTFTNDTANDKSRLSQPLTAGSISKLDVADTSVKSVRQPFDSFGGAVPEVDQQYYVRVSELLRHKGRAIQKFDYERLTLQQFPQLFKVKCINHSFGLDANLYKSDFPYSPGYVILAVIPDLTKLSAGNSFQPKAPVSILEEIEAFLKKRTSPFVRFRAMNPRYEKINFCVRITLLPGKDGSYYKEKLKQDIAGFLAPWAIGRYDKLTFGQCVFRSDVIRFMENTGYVDFVTDFRFSKQANPPDAYAEKVCPDTPRSILIAGDIEICINNPDDEEWMTCYDGKQHKIDCCKTPIVPMTDYCGDNNW